MQAHQNHTASSVEIIFMALSNDEALIERIAAALALRPRSSLQELAKAAGISRATLYRFVPTREQLLSVLTGYAVSLMKRTLDEANLENGKPYGCLSHVTQAFLQHRDVYSFFFTHSVEEALARGALYFAMPEWRFFDERMESFFLRCQKEGFLRIDMPASWMNELYGSAVYGATRAVSLGRVAPVSAHDLVLNSFFNGVSAATAEINP